MEAINTTTEKKPRQSVKSLYIPEALLIMAVVKELTGMSEPTIRRRVKAGTFPAPVRLSARCIRWKAETLQNWLKAQQEVQ